MAEQNILNGDQQVLEQILGDINEHAEKKERLERMSVSIRDITKEIDSTTKAMEDEISSRLSRFRQTEIKLRCRGLKSE